METEGTQGAPRLQVFSRIWSGLASSAGLLHSLRHQARAYRTRSRHLCEISGSPLIGDGGIPARAAFPEPLLLRKSDLVSLVIARRPVGTMTGRRRIICNPRNLTSTNSSISTKTRDCRGAKNPLAPRNDKPSGVHFRPAWCAPANVFAREHGVYSENRISPLLSLRARASGHSNSQSCRNLASSEMTSRRKTEIARTVCDQGRSRATQSGRLRSVVTALVVRPDSRFTFHFLRPAPCSQEHACVPAHANVASTSRDSDVEDLTVACGLIEWRLIQWEHVFKVACAPWQ